MVGQACVVLKVHAVADAVPALLLVVKPSVIDTLYRHSDTMAVADGIAADPFGTVIFAGEVPGIGTHVANTID